MSRNFNGNRHYKYHSNSAYPPKFLVQFEAKYLPQIAPEAVSEHEYVKISWGACPQTPLEVFGFLYLSGSATVQPPQTKMYRSALGLYRHYVLFHTHSLLFFHFRHLQAMAYADLLPRRHNYRLITIQLVK